MLCYWLIQLVFLAFLSTVIFAKYSLPLSVLPSLLFFTMFSPGLCLAGDLVCMLDRTLQKITVLESAKSRYQDRATRFFF